MNNPDEVRVSGIELLRLQALDYAHTESLKHPPQSSRSLVESALLCAYLQGALKSVELARAGFMVVK